MIEKFASDHWSLLVDADEFFDYPYSSRISLKELISYLDNHGFNAVNSTMLDMFSTKPLAELSRMTTREFARENYPYFDLKDISQTLLIENLHSTNNVANKNLNHFKGGIRKTFFGTNNTLTKHPLMRFKNGQPFFKNEHMPRKAIIADFSTVLFHNKLIASFVGKTFQYAEEENHWKNSYEYKMYRETLESNDSLALSTTGMEKYTDMEQLLENGFLITSNQYRRELLGQQRDMI